MDRVGTGLLAVARADDGVVEGVEHPDRWITGVQWHPEDCDGPEADRLRLFEGFTRACMTARAGR